MTTLTQPDPYRLERFVQAQAPVYAQACAELGAGEKQSHWMWFVFPQLAALGHSSTAQFYGIGSRAEALAYWQHPVLGRRLAECTLLVVGLQGRTAHQVFRSPDDLKFRSCMTLFDVVATGEPIFRHALDKYYGGESDLLTLSLLQDLG